MTVQELIDVLKDFDPNAKVRMAEQPNYPLEYGIDVIAEYEGIVYICEGRQIGYLSSEVWDYRD